MIIKIIKFIIKAINDWCDDMDRLTPEQRFWVWESMRKHYWL